MNLPNPSWRAPAHVIPGALTDTIKKAGYWSRLPNRSNRSLLQNFQFLLNHRCRQRNITILYDHLLAGS